MAKKKKKEEKKEEKKEVKVEKKEVKNIETLITSQHIVMIPRDR